jgi:hypothetical protein
MQKDNIISAISLEDVYEFTIMKKAITQEMLNIIHSYGFILMEYWSENGYMFYTFRRPYERII